MEMTEATNHEIYPSKGFVVELSLVIFRALVLETLWVSDICTEQMHTYPSRP